MAILEADI